MYFCRVLAPAAYSFDLLIRSCRAAEPAALHVFLQPLVSSVPSQQSVYTGVCGTHNIACMGRRKSGSGLKSLTTNAIVYKGSVQQQWLVTSVPTVKLTIATRGSACETLT